MIKILFTIPNFLTAGSGGAMLNIIKQLDRNLFEPAVAVLRLGGKLESEIVNLGIPLIQAEFCFPAKPYISLYKSSNSQYGKNWGQDGTANASERGKGANSR